MSDDMIEKRVHKNNIEKHLGQGWEMVKGKGAAGVLAGGDSVKMQIGREALLELRAKKRAPYERLYKAVRDGKVPTDDGEMVEVIRQEKSRLVPRETTTKTKGDD